MRILAAALSIAMWAGSGAFATAPPSGPPTKPVAPVSSSSTTASSAAADAAAARHAKRIACRKQAAEKKLINAPKFDFIKQCMLKP